MWYLIVAFIILGLIYSLFTWLADLVGGAGVLITIIIILTVAFLAFSWAGVFSVIGITVAAGILISILAKAGMYVGNVVKQHDMNVKETAMIQQQTQKENQIHENDKALLEELNKNCFWLGCVNEEMWKRKLPNFVNKQYSSSFEKITMNFAKQIERQHIVQNDDWFEPYKLHVLEHSGGTTVTKMLNEVDCPQLKMTHVTPDGDLINTWLVRGTKRISGDVPPMFRMTFIKEFNENVFTPTEYLEKLYGKTEKVQQINRTEEIDFNDL